MALYFDIYGTHIPMSSIKDFRVIDVEFIYRPVYHEAKKSMLNTFSGKKYEFREMQPYAAVIGLQGQKSALGEYKAKDFKEALGKDISGAVIYTIADALKLKAFKRQKYQCINIAGRAFTTYLDDIPILLTLSDGRITEIFKEDSLYNMIGNNTPPAIQFISALIIKANETFCFYGNGIQIEDASSEFERLKIELDSLHNTKILKKNETSDRLALPSLPKLRLPSRTATQQNPEIIITQPDKNK